MKGLRGSGLRSSQLASWRVGLGAAVGLVLLLSFSTQAGNAAPEPSPRSENAGHQQIERADGRNVVAPGLVRNRPTRLTSHVLQAGWSISMVATLYGTDASLIASLNGIGNPSSVPPGTSLLVPAPDPPPAVLPCGDWLAPLDKQHALPSNCAPGALVDLPDYYAIEDQRVHPEVEVALTNLIHAADSAGHELFVRSSYRSYQEQARTFQFWVDQLGLEQAQRVSARAGHSEHQLGTTVDITSPSVDYDLDEAFADTPEGRWVAANAAQFGFVMSYPDGKEDVTGYAFEPWHFRYVGSEVAQDYLASGLTLNQYLIREWLPGRYLLDGIG